MVRRISILLFVLVFVVCLLYPVGSVLASSTVRNVSVILRDNIVDHQVPYVIRFYTSELLMGGQDTVTMKFPSEVKIASTISRPLNVEINDKEVDTVTFNNNVLTATIPQSINILSDEKVEVVIASGAITNPELAGDYRITVYSSQEAAEVLSSPFYITDYEYTNGVSKPVVNASLASGAAAQNYYISFKTSADGRLTGGIAKIYIEFPSGTQVPTYINGSYISINGRYLYDQTILVEDNLITLPLPSDLNIAAEESVSVRIEAGALIKSLVDSDNNILKVYTSAETREISSLPYSTEAAAAQTVQSSSSSNEIQVVPYPNGSGQNAMYTIIVQPGALSGLSTSITGFVLTFPSGTTIPSAINPQYVTVNGYQASGVMVVDHDIVIALSKELYSSNLININIASGAGLMNPTSAQYRLNVGVFQKTGTIFSAFYTIYSSSTNTTTSTKTNPASFLDTGKTITLQINNTIADIDGTNYVLDSPPIIRNDHTLVPIRFIADTLGATTEYVEAGSYARIVLNGKEIILWVNSQTALCDGQYVSLTSPAIIKNSRLMVPLRFVSEHFGALVSWDSTTQTIEIVYDSTSSTNTSTQTNNTSQYPINYTVAIKSGYTSVNLRSGPGTSYSLLGKAVPAQVMTITATDGNWYKVRLSDGSQAWIANWLVDIQ